MRMPTAALTSAPRRPVFKYTENVRTLHTVPVYMTYVVEVVGDPENAAYEWVIRHDTRGVLAHSDDGYGSPEVALRDGLLALIGPPDDATKLRPLPLTGGTL